MPKMPPIVRRNNQDKIKVLVGNEIKIVPRRKFLKEIGVDGICRLREEEYFSLTKTQKYLTLFNLQQTTHQQGKKYTLCRIIKPGYFTSTTEVLPLLSFTQSLIARCRAVRNNVPYGKLYRDYFKDSISTIKNRKQLQKVIIEKYSQSMPQLSIHKIISLGVAVTRLEIIRYLKDSRNKS